MERVGGRITLVVRDPSCSRVMECYSSADDLDSFFFGRRYHYGKSHSVAGIGRSSSCNQPFFEELLGSHLQVPYIIRGCSYSLHNLDHESSIFHQMNR